MEVQKKRDDDGECGDNIGPCYDIIHRLRIGGVDGIERGCEECKEGIPTVRFGDIHELQKDKKHQDALDKKYKEIGEVIEQGI